MKNLNPIQLIVVAGGIVLLIHGVNIVFNYLGVESEFITNTLDTVINLANNVVGLVFVLAIILYFFQRFRS